MQLVAYTLCLFTLRKNCQERRKKLQVKLLQVLAIFGLIGLAYHQTTLTLIHRWIKFDESLAHGILIIAMSIYLINKRLSSNHSAVNFRVFALLNLASLSLLWFIATASNLVIISQLLLPLITYTFFWCLLGFKQSLSILPSCLFLYFAIPIWDYSNDILVNLSSTTVTWAIQQTGIPAYIQDNTIHLPYGTLIIADGCSGLRYFVVALAITTFIILDSKRDLLRSAKLLVITIILSLTANWIRIFFITLIAHKTNMGSELIADHETFGWIVFMVLLSPIYFFVKGFEPLKIVENVGFTLVSTNTLLILAALLLGPILHAVYSSGSLKSPEHKSNLVGYQKLERRPQHPILPQNVNSLSRRNLANESTLYFVTNWQESTRERLVPYWPKVYNTELWDYYNEGQHHTPHGSYALTLLTHKLTSSKSCLAFRYTVGGIETFSYKIAKLLEPIAIISQKNIFTANIMIFQPSNGDCILNDVQKEALNLLAQKR